MIKQDPFQLARRANNLTTSHALISPFLQFWLQWPPPNSSKTPGLGMGSLLLSSQGKKEYSEEME